MLAPGFGDGGHGPAGKRPQSSPGFDRRLVRAKFITAALRDARQLRLSLLCPPDFAGGWRWGSFGRNWLRSERVSPGLIGFRGSATPAGFVGS